MRTAFLLLFTPIFSFANAQMDNENRNQNIERETASVTWIGGSGTGTQKTSWNRAGNWSSNSIPNASSDVLIPSGSYMPVVTNATLASCRNLTLDTTATLTVSTSSSGSLSVYGGIVNNGFILYSVSPSNTTQYLQLYGVNTSLGGNGTWSNTPCYFNSGSTYTISDNISFSNFYLDDNSTLSFAANIVNITKSLVQKGTWNLNTSQVNFSGDDGTVPSAMTPNYPDLKESLFNAGSSTFSYSSNSGTKTQYITAAHYYNLNVNSNGTCKTPLGYFTSASTSKIYCNDLVLQQGTNTVTSGYIYLYAPLVVAGNLTIGSGCTLDANDHISTTAANTTDNPIYLSGSWINNGIFINGFLNGIENNASTVLYARSLVFTGSSDVYIKGSSVTSFYNFRVQKSNSAKVIISEDSVTINNIFFLDSGVVDLGANSLWVSNSNVNSIQRNKGYCLSENTEMKGRLKRCILNNFNVTYEFPFGYQGKYIPFSFRLSEGYVNSLSVATYHADHMHPYPPKVSSIFNTSHSRSDSAYMVHRYWEVERNGSGKADICFTYADTEVPDDPTGYHGNEDKLKAQLHEIDEAGKENWLKSSAVGDSQGYSPDSNTVWVNGVSSFSSWAIVKGDSPLPVGMLSLKAISEKSSIKLAWCTGTEINNDHFEIKKYVNGQKFFLGKVRGAINSATRHYYLFEDAFPSQGENCYELYQSDVDGNLSMGGTACADVGEDQDLLIERSEHSLRILYHSRSCDKVIIRIIDTFGKVITEKEEEEKIDCVVYPIREGLYILNINDNGNILNRKIFF